MINSILHTPTENNFAFNVGDRVRRGKMSGTIVARELYHGLTGKAYHGYSVKQDDGIDILCVEKDLELL